jgi:hypothetical protein
MSNEETRDRLKRTLFRLGDIAGGTDVNSAVALSALAITASIQLAASEVSMAILRGGDVEPVPRHMTRAELRKLVLTASDGDEPMRLLAELLE